jgi:hemolysin activation/secretion protein
MKKLLSLILLFTTVYSASMPNIGDLLHEIKPPNIEKKKEILPPLQQDSEEFKKTFKDGKKVLIKSFEILNATQLSKQELQNIVKPYENKMLSFKQIQDITDAITKAYQDTGYFVARAYIPLQNIQEQNNILKIALIEGKYGKFHLQNSSLVKNVILENTLKTLKDKNTISSLDLQRVLYIINDTPGVKITSSKIKAGKEVGTSDFYIQTEATQKYDGYIIGDNYGSKSVGDYRAMTGVNINSPFNIGDKLSLFGLSSENKGLLNANISYDFPLLANGLRAQIGYSRTTYELGNTYKDLDALGYANNFNIKLSYPYMRLTDKSLILYLNTSCNQTKDEIRASDVDIKKNIYVATLGMQYTTTSLLFNKLVQISLEPSLSIGKLTFMDDKYKQSDEAGANTNGNFSKANLDIKQKIFLAERFEWNNKLTLQYALGNKNLDGSEDLSLGGINGVKLYPNSEESAENGYLFNTEFTYNLPSFYKINSKVGIFYEVGRIYMSQNVSGQESRTLQDIGLSYYGTYKNFFINSHLAYKVDSKNITSEDDYNAKFLCQVGYLF